MMNMLIPVITMGALGFLFSFGLVFAYKKLRVEVDPKIEVVAEILPRANCGGCGFAGCQAFAEAVVAGKVAVSGCPVGGKEVADRIAEILGEKSVEVVKKLARVHCRGTKEAARPRGEYFGVSTCFASHLLGGDKQCSYGCLGLGDCVRACPFEAMYMSEEGLPVVIEEKCTGCSKCVEACPRNIIELHPQSQEIIVFCRSLDRGPVAKRYCDNACIACGICVRACPEAIIMEDNLAKIIDYEKIDLEKIQEIEKCPTQSIGRLHKS